MCSAVSLHLIVQTCTVPGDDQETVPIGSRFVCLKLPVLGEEYHHWRLKRGAKPADNATLPELIGQVDHGS